MKHLLALICLLAVAAVRGDEPRKGSKEIGDAKLTFRAKMTNDLVSMKVEGESLTLVGVELRKGQTVYVQTVQDFSTRAAEKSKKLLTLIHAQTKAITDAAKEFKGDELKKALERIRRDFEEQKKALEDDTVVVEGVITKLGKITAKGGPVNIELGDNRTIRVVGEIRDLDPKGKPEPPEAGFVVLRGELQPGKVDLGRDVYAPFSVKSGAIAIAIGGKQANAFTAKKGLVKVTGSLRVSDNGIAVIDADKVEAGDK